MNPAPPASRLLRREWRGAAVVAVLVALFYWPHFDLSRMQTGGDFANLFWPMKEFRVRSLFRDHAVPLWNPWIFMGTPALATLQHAFLYPVDLLFFWRSPTIGALNLYVAAHLMWCGIGAWWWARRGVGLGDAGAILCGAAFPCCAWFWGQQEHINQVGTVAWMPWIAGIALLFLRGGLSARRFAPLYAFASAMQFLVGHPQAAFYTHLFVAILVLGKFIAQRNDLPGELRRVVPPFAAALGICGLLVAPTLLPALELSGFSYRQFRDESYSLTFSMPPEMLKLYLSPHAFGDYINGYADQRAYNEYGVFVGRGVLLLAGLGALATRRRLLALLSLVGILALLLAMGGNVAPARLASRSFTEFPEPAFSLHWLYTHLLPPAAGFRVPARIIILASLAIATLAGAGLDLLARRLGTTGAKSRAITGVVIGACLVDLYLASTPEKFRHPKDYSALLVEFDADRSLRPEPTIDDRIFRLTLADLDLMVAERQQSAEAQYPDGVWYRWMRWQENNNVAVELPSIDGYEEGLAPTVRTKDFLFAFNRHLRGFRPDLQLLSLLGVSEYFSDLPIDTEHMPLVAEHSRGDRKMYANPYAKGAAFWLPQADGILWRWLDGPYALGGRPLGERSNEVIKYGVADRFNSNWPRIRTRLDGPDRILLESERGRLPGDAVLSIGRYPNWMVRRPAGWQEVRWRSAFHAIIPKDAFRDGPALVEFRPFSWSLGLYLGCVGAAILAAWCVRRRAA